MSPDVERKIDMMTLSVELKTNDGFERQTERRWWLWMPKLRDDNGSEHQTENADGSERRDWEEIMALNAKWKILMALNAETKKWWWLWMPKLRIDNGSERRNWEAIMMALNVETENEDGSEHRYWEVIMMALDAKWRCDDGSKRWNRECDIDGSESQNWRCDEDGFEHRYWEVIMMDLNAERRCNGSECHAETKTRLWMPKRRYGSESQNEARQWLWTPNQKKHRWMPIWNKSSACPTKLVTRNVMLRKTTLNIVNEKTRWLERQAGKG